MIRKISLLLVVIMLLSSIFVPLGGAVNAAEGAVFTISPPYTNSSLPSTNVVVTSNNPDTFTPDSSYPVLVNGSISRPLTITNSTSTSVTCIVPNDIENGTYELRIGDPKGNLGTM